MEVDFDGLRNTVSEEKRPQIMTNDRHMCLYVNKICVTRRSGISLAKEEEHKEARKTAEGSRNHCWTVAEKDNAVNKKSTEDQICRVPGQKL